MPNQVAQVKLPLQMMQALYRAYVDSVHHFHTSTEHDQLLLVHSKAMSRMLRDRLENNRTKYSFGFTEAEALAFIQWWQMVPVMVGTLEQVAIAEVIQVIDLVAKRQRFLKCRAIKNYSSQ